MPFPIPSSPWHALIPSRSKAVAERIAREWRAIATGKSRIAGRTGRRAREIDPADQAVHQRLAAAVAEAVSTITRVETHPHFSHVQAAILIPVRAATGRRVVTGAGDGQGQQAAGGIAWMGATPLRFPSGG